MLQVLHGWRQPVSWDVMVNSFIDIKRAEPFFLIVFIFRVFK